MRSIGEIVAGNRAIPPDSGLRLSRFFGMNDSFWIGLQVDDGVCAREGAWGNFALHASAFAAKGC